MSNAYDSASLLVTPNGYKASKIYSAKPTDGTGDLAFSRASNATRVNQNGLIEVVSNNIPRLNYPIGGGCPSWLFEPQSTNTITFSEDASSCFPTKIDVTITANNTNSPDGTQNADLVSFDTTTAYVLRGQVVAPATTYTMSCFIKNNNYLLGELLYFNMSDGVVGGLNAAINVVAKTATFSGSLGAFTGISGSIQDYGNGWFRVTITGTSVLGGTGWYEFGGLTNIRSCFLWGFSLELGSVATSYIPTAGSAVTRLADQPAALTTTLNQTELTLYFEGKVNSANNSSANLITTNQNTTSAIGLIRKQDGQINLFVIIGGATVIGIDSVTTYALGQKIKVVGIFKSGQVKLYINGLLKASSAITYTLTTPINQLNILSSTTYFGYQESSLWDEAILYNVAISGTEAIELTTI